MSILMQSFRKKVSKLKDYRMKVETEFPVAYSTGFLNFDFANGTVVHTKKNNKEFKYYSVGITDGSMIMVIGRSGCGKTTWVVQTASNIIKPFKTSCIFHDDIEGGLNENRRIQLTGMTSEQLQDKYLIRNTGITAENFFERIAMIHDIKINNRESFEYDTGLYDSSRKRIYKLEPTIYILDSLALLMPDKYSNEDELSGQMSTTASAKANAGIFRRIIPKLKAANIILFIINHINDKVAISPSQMTKAQVSYLKAGETLPGGKMPIYLSNNMIRFDDHSKLKQGETFNIDGNMVDISLVKSRSNKAGKKTTLVFDQEHGFDPELSLFVLLKQHKLVNGAGAYLYLGDANHIKFSQKKFKQKLKEIPELKEIFINMVINLLTSLINKEDHYNEEKDNSITFNILDKIYNKSI